MPDVYIRLVMHFYLMTRAFALTQNFNNLILFASFSGCTFSALRMKGLMYIIFPLHELNIYKRFVDIID